MEFQYLAYTSQGREERGSVAAENAARAFVILRRRDLHPVKLERSPWPALGRSMSMFKVSKITLQELGEICREISLLLSASLPINTALAATSQKRSGASGAMLRRVEVAVEQGIPLGQALERESTLPEMLWQTVRAAEMGSALPRVFAELADFFLDEQRQRQKTETALFYPKILIALTAIISVFILTFLMPSYVSTFVRSGVELPWTTRMLVTLWNSFQAFWLLILPIFITVGIVILRAWRHLKRHPQVDRLLLLLPYFGPLRTARMLALLCRTLAMLLSSGVTLDLALFNTQRLPTSPLWRDALQQARRRLREGRLLSEAIAESGCFPNQLVQMLHVGESGGELPQLLRQAASFYQQRAALQAEHLGQLMQPIAMLGAALFIGGLSVALISPLYAQLDLIQNVAKIY